MRTPPKWLLLVVLALGLANCSGQRSPLPNHTVSTAGAISRKSPAAAQLKDLFSTARGKKLTDRELDAYISTALTPADRAIAHQLMKFMPPSQRADFLYATADGRIISNSSVLLAHAKLTFTAMPAAIRSGARKTYFAGVRRSMDYSSSCSPTNPYAGSGPYVRQVSRCGFSAGWAFLKVPCGTTQLNWNDNGYTYFEITGPNNSAHIEGGMFTQDGIMFDPYLRSDAIVANNGYETLTNSSARFTCDELMGLFHGVTNTVPNYSFTEIGDASQYDPYTAWVAQEQISLSDTAWLFGSLPSNVSASGIDAAGYLSPCMYCSISQVTGIAQSNAASWNADASEFGIDSSGSNAIQWLQVAFGNWATNCSPGTSLCTFDVSADPFAYYGGAQAYPDGNVAGSNFSVAGYGP
jgi:hypothetical protein